MITDVRRFPGNFWMNELVDASVIRRTWWGKRIDKYWEFLDNNTKPIDIEFDSHLLADVFAYFFDKLKFKELFNEYSNKLTKNRGAFVLILIPEDKEKLMPILADNFFLADLADYAKELNGEFYNYTDQLLEDTTTNLKRALATIDDDSTLIINIG